MATIRWYGDRVRAKVADAAAIGIDRTTAACVHDAAANHPAFPPASEPGERYANRTGHLTGSLHAGEAELDGERVAGHWGDYARYALFLEIGTSREESGFPTATAREEAAGGNIDAVPPPSEPPLMAARPYLRPAADREYPMLAARIGAAFRGEQMP